MNIFLLLQAKVLHHCLYRSTIENPADLSKNDDFQKGVQTLMKFIAVWSVKVANIELTGLEKEILSAPWKINKGNLDRTYCKLNELQ